MVLLGVVMVALVSIPVAVYAFDLFDIREFFSGAQPTSVTPANVYITNITESGATVTWTTFGTPTVGNIRYGATVNEQNNQSVYDDRVSGVANTKFETHHMTIRGLQPDTSYSYTIYNDEVEYTSGSPSSFTFQTAPLGDTPSIPTPIIGTISNVDTVGQDSIIYLYLSKGQNNSVVYSTTSQLDGNFSIDVGGIRSSQVANLYELDASSAMNLYVAAKTGLYSKTVTDWVTELGTIQLGGQAIAFDFPALDYTPVVVVNKEVTISNLDEGESIDGLPSLIGTANPNEDLVVTLTGPTFISDDVVADANGDYRYTITRELESGNYSAKVASVSREGQSTTVRFTVVGTTTSNANTNTNTDTDTNDTTDTTNDYSTPVYTDNTYTDTDSLPQTGIEDYVGIIAGLLILFISGLYLTVIRKLH